MEPVYIVDEIEAVVAKTSAALNGVNPPFGKIIHYMYGHPLEIVTRLQEMTQSPTQAANKYPLVALFTDFQIERGDRPDMYGRARLQLIVATITENTYQAPQRMEKNFKPILYPIYNEFLYQLFRHKQFSVQSEEELKHTQIDRMYWGKQGLYGNVGNIFNDYIDCIELQNLIVNVKNKIC